MFCIIHIILTPYDLNFMFYFHTAHNLLRTPISVAVHHNLVQYAWRWHWPWKPPYQSSSLWRNILSRSTQEVKLLTGRLHDGLWDHTKPILQAWKVSEDKFEEITLLYHKSFGKSDSLFAICIVVGKMEHHGKLKVKFSYYCDFDQAEGNTSRDTIYTYLSAARLCPIVRLQSFHEPRENI